MTTTETIETTETLYTIEELLNEETSEEIEEIIGLLDSEELEVIEAILELSITYFKDWNSYYDYCDETIEFPKGYGYLERYFDYDSFHRDCWFDVSEAPNGVILGDW